MAADGRGAWRQIEPMRFADHGVFGNIQPSADLGGRMTFRP
jgi:hypothetical protein